MHEYKGCAVAIKCYRYMKKVEISHECKKELLSMRDMHSDNVNAFRGLIVHPGGYGVSVSFELMLDGAGRARILRQGQSV